MQENRKDVGSFDEVLNSLYGEPGTPQRDEFRREAYTYCVATIIHDARKREGITQQQLADRVGAKCRFVSHHHQCARPLYRSACLKYSILT